MGRDKLENKIKMQNAKCKIKKVERIGVFGGTFNPIHNGHLLIAEEILEKLDLDKVLFIPTANPPHKKNSDLLGGSYRLKMVELAIKNNPHFSVSDIEIKRGGMSYSIETIKTLKEIYVKGTKFFFIMGADSIVQFTAWKDWEDLLKLCNFVVSPRPGYDIDLNILKNKMRGILQDKSLVNKIILFETKVFDVSSTDIKEKIKKGESLKYFVPEEVIKYIKKHKLYGK